MSFEWPKSNLGWHQDALLKFITRYNLYSITVHGCALGMKNDAGEPVLKEWRFVTTSARLAAALEPLKCKHEKGFKHGELSGGSTAKSAIYPLKLCHTMLSSLYGFMERTPAMMCSAASSTSDVAGVVANVGGASDEGGVLACVGGLKEHREKEPMVSPFGISTGLQGGGAALFFDVGGSPSVVPDQCTGPENSLVGRLADADPDAYDELVDTSGVEASDMDVLRAFVTKLLDHGAVRRDPLAKAARRAEKKGADPRSPPARPC